jgi:hypothetical protein
MLNFKRQSSMVLVDPPSDLGRFTSNLDYDYVLVTSMRVVARSHPYLQQLAEWKRYVGSKGGSAASMDAKMGAAGDGVGWFEKQALMDQIRENTRNLLSFMTANPVQPKVHFVLLFNDGVKHGDEAMRFELYQDGAPRPFQPIGTKSETPVVSEVNCNSGVIKWSPPSYGIPSVTCYTVMWRPVDIGTADEKWSSISLPVVTGGGTTPLRVTLNELASGGKFEVKVRAECAIGHSPDSATAHQTNSAFG